MSAVVEGEEQHFANGEETEKWMREPAAIEGWLGPTSGNGTERCDGLAPRRENLTPIRLEIAGKRFLGRREPTGCSPCLKECAIVVPKSSEGTGCT
jgi:hypothetical protein